MNMILRKMRTAFHLGPAETWRLLKLRLRARLPNQEPPRAPALTAGEIQCSTDRALLRKVFRLYFYQSDLAMMRLIILRLRELQRTDPIGREEAHLAKLSAKVPPELDVIDLLEAGQPCQIQVEENRICYLLHNSLPYSSGGYATRSHGLATALNSIGYDVVATTRPGFPLDNVEGLTHDEVALEEMLDGVTYCRLLGLRRLTTPMRQYIIESADEVEKHLRHHCPAIVMAASNFQTGFPALVAARRLGLPFVYEVRGFWEVTRISRQPKFATHPAFFLQEFMEAELCRQADHVFTLTSAMKDELVRRNVPGSKISLLPNACNTDNFVPRRRFEELAARLQIPIGVPVIGYIGSFVQYEGLDDLAEACAILKKRGMEFRLLIVGNENVSGQDTGPITAKIRNIVEETDLSNWVIMPGRVPHHEVADYYSLIDIAPFPRKPQPVTEMVSPMKPLEAMAMERAVLISSVAGMEQMIAPGNTGEVFKKGDVTDLADKLEMLLVNPDRRAGIGKAARKWVAEERSWERTAREASEVFEKLHPTGGRSDIGE